MSTDHGAVADRLQRAITDTALGVDPLAVDLSDLEVIDVVDVREGTATVRITLPIPSKQCRTAVERELKQRATDVNGVTDVSVQWDPAVTGHGSADERIPDVKHVVAVGSGKGGVGKSTVATNMAVALAEAGANVGLLDADIYGPNAPTMLGLDDRAPEATMDDRIIPREAHGVKVMSMGFVVGEDDPVIWRGPLVDDILRQLFDDVEWGELDYLLIDLPPGTGDAQLSIVQHLRVTGAVIVTTPQPVAVDDARRGLNQFDKYEIPILGIVENMSQFVCPDCENRTELFGSGGGHALAKEYECPLLAQIPLDQVVNVPADRHDADEPGVTLPLLGRLRLPRTREERERRGRSLPVAIRDSSTTSGSELRRGAGRMAARIAERSTREERA